MAGKHQAAWVNAIVALPGFQWNERTTKAYAEGRSGLVANGHPTGSPAFIAYQSGAAGEALASQQFETADT